VYFDSHCHLTEDRFDGDREEVIERARDAGLAGIVTVASDVDDAGRAARLAAGHEHLWSTAGIHPHRAGEARDGDLARIRELVEKGAPTVAVGETGLDYHYDNAPRSVQRRWFREQVKLAIALEAPVVVHAREADDDVRALVREMGREVRGVLHCYTSGIELLEEGLEAGWYVSYSGIASFRSFEGRAGVRTVPRERLLVETDSPYLAPEPRRGQRNEPAFVVHVAQAVGRIRGEKGEEVGRYAAENARRFYGI